MRGDRVTGARPDEAASTHPSLSESPPQALTSPAQTRPAPWWLSDRASCCGTGRRTRHSSRPASTRNVSVGGLRNQLCKGSGGGGWHPYANHLPQIFWNLLSTNERFRLPTVSIIIYQSSNPYSSWQWITWQKPESFVGKYFYLQGICFGVLCKTSKDNQDNYLKL